MPNSLCVSLERINLYHSWEKYKILKKETAFRVDFGVTNLPHLHRTMRLFSVSEFRFQTPGYLLGSETRPEPPNLSLDVPAAGEPK